MAGREFSRNQLDKLGERLLEDPISPNDLESLSKYRAALRSRTVRSLLIVRIYGTARGHAVSERPEKTLSSIRRKLRDTTIRLGDMDDLVGCRITVQNRSQQRRVSLDLSEALSMIRWIDRNARPSNGYRALHGIQRVDGIPLEIQVRTSLQDAWANLSESLSDRLGDPSLKYGGGPQPVRKLLDIVSNEIADFESDELYIEHATVPDFLARIDEGSLLELAAKLETGAEALAKIRANVVEMIETVRGIVP